MQLFRETRTGFLLGAQHGRQDAAVPQLTLTIEPVDVFEEFVRIHDADREADRDDDAQIDDPCPGFVTARFVAQLYDVLDRQQKESDDEKDPHRIVFGRSHQTQGEDRGDGLDQNGDDKQKYQHGRSVLFGAVRTRRRVRTAVCHSCSTFFMCLSCS